MRKIGDRTRQASKSKVSNESSNESDSTTEDLSLKNLVLWTTEPIERMRWLAVSCESVYTLRGTAIISQIYSYVNTAGAEIYLNKVLEDKKQIAQLNYEKKVAALDESIGRAKEIYQKEPTDITALQEECDMAEKMKSFVLK